jgi:hypothetical protein
MPWLSLPYADRAGKQKIGLKYGVSSLPTLIMIGSFIFVWTCVFWLECLYSFLIVVHCVSLVLTLILVHTLIMHPGPDDEREVLCTADRQLVMEDLQGEKFPWEPNVLTYNTTCLYSHELYSLCKTLPVTRLA